MPTLAQMRSIGCGAALCASTFFAIPTSAAPVQLVSETFDAAGSTQLSYFGFSGDMPKVENGKLAIPYAQSGRFATSHFATTTLDYGDALTVSFQLTATRVQTPADFRLGIYDSLGTAAIDHSPASRDAAASDRGYLVTLRDDPGLFYSGVTQSDFTGSTLTGEVGGYNGAYTFADGLPHELKYVFRNVSATNFQVELYYDNALRVTTGVPVGVTTFDNIQFGFSNFALSGVQLDNLQVLYTAVPEPASAFALVAGAMSITRRRQHNRR